MQPSSCYGGGLLKRAFFVVVAFLGIRPKNAFVILSEKKQQQKKIKKKKAMKKYIS